MTKTQPSVLKQCISRTLILFIFSGFLTVAQAYTSVAPFEKALEPATGLIFEPETGFQTGLTTETELNLGLDAALSDDLSGYARYSLQNDERLGMSLRLLQNQTFTLSAQTEASLNQDSSLQATIGMFASTPIRLKNLPSLSLTLGLALTHNFRTENTDLPFSISLAHTAGPKAWTYSLGFSGETSPSDASTWISMRTELAYETASHIQYLLTALVPATETTSEKNVSLKIGLAIPFGGETAEKKFIPRTSPYRESKPEHYDMNATVTSMNEALFLIKIDKGSSDSVAKGQTFDIYSGDDFLARAEVVAVKTNEAALNVVEYKQEHWIELGFSARRLDDRLGE
jgi:hypothetical protein